MITTIFILSRALLSVESRPHHIRGILQQQQQQFSHFTLPHVLEEASEQENSTTHTKSHRGT